MNAESNLNDRKQKNNITNLFTKKESCYYKMIDKFFKDCTDEQITKMLGIINKESEISLRILDWFVTRYSKKRIDFDLGVEEVFDVYISYKAQLKSYKKTYFDPFRRRKKFYYCYDKHNNKKQIYTTIGQLNFFRWAITNNIIDYVEKNLISLTKAMNSANKEDKKKKKYKNSSEEDSDNNDNIDDDDNDDDDNDDNDDNDNNDNDDNESNNDNNDNDNDINKNLNDHVLSPKNINDNDKKKNKKIMRVKNKKINITASENTIDDEIQIVLNFD
jgi:hypothetical protein